MKSSVVTLIDALSSVTVKVKHDRPNGLPILCNFVKISIIFLFFSLVDFSDVELSVMDMMMQAVALIN